MPKARKKGKKEIHKENLEIISFYQKFSLIGCVIQLINFLILSSSWWDMVLVCFGVAVHATALWGLSSMGRPLLGPNRELVEAGSELATSWIAEYLKDVVILTTGLQVLSGVTNYVWFLWLLAPGYLLYKAWTVLIWPWITAESPGGMPQAGMEQKAAKKKYRKIH